MTNLTPNTINEYNQDISMRRYILPYVRMNGQPPSAFGDLSIALFCRQYS